MPRHLIDPDALVRARKRIEALQPVVARRSVYHDDFARHFDAIRDAHKRGTPWSTIATRYFSEDKPLPTVRTMRRLYVAHCEAYGLDTD